LKKDRQHNGQNKKDKRTNTDRQNITHKTEDRVARTPFKTGSEFKCSWRVNSWIKVGHWNWQELILCVIFFLLFYRNLGNNPWNCSSCNLEALKVFLNNQAQLGDASAKCNGTSTHVVNHDFQNCAGKYCERSRTKYNWTVEKITEMTDWREHENM